MGRLHKKNEADHGPLESTHAKLASFRLIGSSATGAFHVRVGYLNWGSAGARRT